MTRTDSQNFTTLLDTIAQRRNASDGTVSAESSTHIPEVKAANVPQEVKDAVQPAETGMLEQLGHTGAAAYTYAQRVLAGDISREQFENLISQLMDSAQTQFHQLQDSTVAKLKSLGNQHPDWQQAILSVFQAVSDLLIEVLNKEFGFLTTLMTDTPQQAGQVNGFFSGLVRYLEDGWSQIVG
ncbi:hypothetical protein [Nocardia gamkensis]|uniref:Uncharacterized protein n=1 Tax=Nocardia gamkensis TaxID=352869 RepID=A0A7X6L6N4_9NOCA|nr:hypothetical protein [Nocardia gamkensis]NKY28565.1 hypothetical protein [Nocardia gamkensis]NQE71284.1 hypothetical protein [Nocardia gamkensis]